MNTIKAGDYNIEPVSDSKEDITYWSNLLKNDKLNKESIELINQCLQQALKQHINPSWMIRTEEEK